MGRYYAEAYNMTIMTTRMFTHTGPRRGDVFHESSFAKQVAMIELGMQEPVIKVGNLNSLRLADVRDAVRASLDAHYPNHCRDIINIGGTYYCKVADTLQFFIDHSTMKDKIKFIPTLHVFVHWIADLQVPNLQS